jgi:enolase
LAKILAVKAREILDSRGNPTVECEIKTSTGISRASVPSGASTGVNEALELRDGGKRFGGKGVLKAVNNINKSIAKKIIGKDATKQQQIDELMIKLDGTKNKKKLGANAILAVSMAVARAGAASKKMPLYAYLGELFENKKFILPVPSFNIINGGKHAGNKLDIQEYMILPIGAKSFSEAIRIGAEVYHKLKGILEENYGKNAVNVGDEGGFAPPISCFEKPFDHIIDAVTALGYWKKVKIGIDAAATTFYRDGNYYLEGQEYTTEELKEKYVELAENFPLISIEDPFYEEDFEGFAKLTKELKELKLTRTQVVGDDLTVTNPKRVQKAIVHGSCNCLLLKINQIGTITEAMEAAKMALAHNWKIMVSHRSGETTDSFISDLAVGIASGQIKSGAPCRGERLAKYNQLLRIEEALGKKAVYGKKPF